MLARLMRCGHGHNLNPLNEGSKRRESFSSQLPGNSQEPPAALADQILRDVAEIAAAECGQGQQAVATPALAQLSHCPATLWVSANGVSPVLCAQPLLVSGHMSQRATEWVTSDITTSSRFGLSIPSSFRVK